MPKPYSYDLRQKVIQAMLLDGLKINEASQTFSISRNTIRIWLKRQRETGDFQSLPNQPLGNNHKITDWSKFAAFVEKYLPSYSPDLNKIEQCWSWLKSRIRKQLIQGSCLRDTMEAVLRTAT